MRYVYVEMQIAEVEVKSTQSKRRCRVWIDHSWHYHQKSHVIIGMKFTK